MSRGISESEALDIIEDLVQEDKGTDDPKLRAVRHALHKAGRLNKPDPEGPFVVFVPRSSGSFDLYGADTWSDAVSVKRNVGVPNDNVIRRIDPADGGYVSGASWWAKRLFSHEATERQLGETPSS